jgi:hypothetical protein
MISAILFSLGKNETGRQKLSPAAFTLDPSRPFDVPGGYLLPIMSHYRKHVSRKGGFGRSWADFRTQILGRMGCGFCVRVFCLI